MSHTRALNPDSPCAYRVGQEIFGRTVYYGPYSTPAGAKAKRTNLIHQNKYRDNAQDLVIWIEKTPDGWEKVDI